MFAMFAQLFSALRVLFSATEKAAKSFENLTIWTEETSRSFAEEARITRKAKYLQLLEETGVNEDEVVLLPAPVFPRLKQKL